MAISKKKQVSKKQELETTNVAEIMNDFDRVHWVKEAAYYMAEARGFVTGYERDDWEMAEEDFDNCFVSEPI